MIIRYPVGTNTYELLEKKKIAPLAKRQHETHINPR